MRDLCTVHQVEDCPACMQAEIELLRDGAKRAVDDAYALAEENRRLTALVESMQSGIDELRRAFWTGVDVTPENINPAVLKLTTAFPSTSKTSGAE